MDVHARVPDPSYASIKMVTEYSGDATNIGNAIAEQLLYSPWKVVARGKGHSRRSTGQFVQTLFLQKGKKTTGGPMDKYAHEFAYGTLGQSGYTVLRPQGFGDRDQLILVRAYVFKAMFRLGYSLVWEGAPNVFGGSSVSPGGWRENMFFRLTGEEIKEKFTVQDVEKALDEY